MAATAWLNWDDFRCIAFVFLLGFKPSEPHLSTYFSEFIHLSDYQINAEVYTVASYAAPAVLTLLVVSQLGGQFGSDKPIIVFGALCRLVTRLLLLFGTSVQVMQVMQVFYALGTLGDGFFYAYCLRISSNHPVRTMALSQATNFVAPALAGLVGDVLLATTSADLKTLMWISLVSVSGAVCVALSLRSENVLYSAPSLRDQASSLLSAYRSNHCILVSCWVIVSYATNSFVYDYESSFYLQNIDISYQVNGSINAAAVGGAAATCFLLSFDCVASRFLPNDVSYRATAVLLVMGSLGAVCVLVYSTFSSSVVALAILFPLYMMGYSFCNAIAHAEFRRAVGFSYKNSDLDICVEAPADECCEQEGSTTGKYEIVSVLIAVNLWAGSVLHALLMAIYLQWSKMELKDAYIVNSVGMLAVMGVLAVSAFVSLFFRRARGESK